LPPSPPHHSTPTHLSTPPLHDALPISSRRSPPNECSTLNFAACAAPPASAIPAAKLVAIRICCEPRIGFFHLVFGSTVTAFPASDRKSTRLNSSHLVISYAVFCLTEEI